MRRGTREYATWSLGMILVLIFALLPVVWIISLSLKSPETVGDGRFLPAGGEWTLKNYKVLFEGGFDNSPFIHPLINSIAIALIATAIAIVLAAFAAYAIARLNFPGKSIILGGALAIAMFPAISTIGPLFDMWRSIGLYDTYPGLIIPYLTFSLPLAIYTLVAFYREIPWDLEQAAQVDGATPFQAFRRVILPLAAPGTFTAAILVFIFCWNDFLFAITLTSSNNARTVPAALAFFTGESQFTQPTGNIAAAAVIVTIPIIIFVLFFQRRIVAGLTAGAVKGYRQGGEEPMAEIVLDKVTKRYPDGFEAVRNMDLDINDGEFMILVGPSGSGKSTALRMIAGLEDISDGEVKIGDTVVNQMAPKDRDIAMVFQNYALYPHMSVRENMAFPLKLAGTPKEEIDQKVQEAAKILDLTEHLDRRPANLSGGQRQRVAMGRAIVRNPKAFLRDEPLSNLDAKLRVQMRTEVSRIQSQLGTTTVYVTHDQTEAMTLGDRVAVMRSGVLQQVDTPRVLYNDPVNIFVAGFIGPPAMSFFSGKISGGTIQLPFAKVPAPEGVPDTSDVVVGIRPENFEDARFAPDNHPDGVEFEAPIELVELMGS